MIRAETNRDYKDIYELNVEAFGAETESKLIEALRKDKCFVPELSLVALDQENIVGHLLLTKLTTTKQVEGGLLTLAPMAVSPTHQNKGIGTSLIEEGIKRAKELGYKGIIVLGHSKYYPKFGFVPASTYNITCPYDVPDEVFMALELIEDGLKDFSGCVVYPKAFDEV